MIEVVADPLADRPAEAVLRPTRTDWAALTAQVRRLDRMAGPGWLETCSRQGSFPLGSAVITGAGELPVEFVIHLAVASLDEPASVRSVSAALRNALRRAAEWEVRSLSTPLIGTGPGALDPEASCHAMRPHLSEFTAGGPDLRVWISAEDDPSLEAARAVWTAATGG